MRDRRAERTAREDGGCALILDHVINLALDLASTIRHDGRGGAADDLLGSANLTAWVRERATALGSWAATFTANERMRCEVVALRAGVRALLAHAVRPGPPSPPDADRLLPLPEAFDRVNTAAARVPVVPQLQWPADGEPAIRLVWQEPDPVIALTASIARATVGLLGGADRVNLRACTAPRCVRYFVKEHGRQEFCKPSCSNRARAARHYQRQHQTVGDGAR
jgi:predicted RNA-binding Zn ribbon-like protein